MREIRFYNAKWKMLVVSLNKLNSVFCVWMCSYSHVIVRYHKMKTTLQELVIFILSKYDVITDSVSCFHIDILTRKNQLAQTHLGQNMNNLIYFQAHTI